MVFVFFIYIFYHFPCRKDQFTALILKFGIEDFINPGATQKDPGGHYWFVFVVLPSHLFLIKGLANFRKKNYGVAAKNEGKRIGRVLFFFINIIIILISSFLEIDFAINSSDKKSRRFDLSEVIFKCIKVL